jgi:hypothetical protein
MSGLGADLETDDGDLELFAEEEVPEEVEEGGEVGRHRWVEFVCLAKRRKGRSWAGKRKEAMTIDSKGKRGTWLVVLAFALFRWWGGKRVGRRDMKICKCMSMES